MRSLNINKRPIILLMIGRRLFINQFRLETKMITVLGKGDTVFSFRSCSVLEILKVDFINQMYVDANGRSVKFCDCQTRTKNGRTIGDVAMSGYKNIDGKTAAYIMAANDTLGVNFFTHTVFNSDGRLFAGGEVEENKFLFVDLEDIDRTVYTLAELQSLDTDQNWYVL